MKVNLACGNDIRPGYVNVDISPLPGVTPMNLLEFPWKFDDGSVDEVACNNFVEHLPHDLGGSKDGFFVFFEELHRVMKPGALAVIRVPSPSSPNNLADPTHTRVIVPANFAFMDPDYPSKYYTSARFKLVSWRRIWCPPYTLGYHIEKYLRVRLNIMPYDREYVLQRV